MTNRALITGEVATTPEFNHEAFGEKIYSFLLKSARMSGVEDTVPVMVPERLTDISRIQLGDLLKIEGSFRSFNEEIDGRRRLSLFLFAANIETLTDLSHDRNFIDLEGYICKEPVHRTTPAGREIADFFLAVNRNYRKSDYIPCICWGRNAGFVSTLPVGTHITIRGRIQSREYEKRIGEEIIQRVAYEVSANRIRVISNEKEDAREETKEESDNTSENSSVN